MINKNLNIPLLLFVILIFQNACQSTEKPFVTRIDIVYNPSSKDVSDAILWYSKISIASNDSLVGDAYLVYEQDTFLCETDIGFSSSWMKNDHDEYELYVSNSQYFKSLTEYYQKNTSKLENSAIIFVDDKSQQWLCEMKSAPIHYYIEDRKVDLKDDSLLIDNMEYYRY
jgi:hypothetical protein